MIVTDPFEKLAFLDILLPRQNAYREHIAQLDRQLDERIQKYLKSKGLTGKRNVTVTLPEISRPDQDIVFEVTSGD